MANPKKALSTTGKPMHYSVGAIIKKENKYLLIDRAVPPPGFAGVAGHVDENETDEQALKREVKEESNLDVTHCTLLLEEEVEDNPCVLNCTVHHWKVFKCITKGEVHKNNESKLIGWFTPAQIQNLNLEPVWKYWFQKLNIIE